MITIVSYSASTECTDPTADNASSFIADVVVASCAVHTFPDPQAAHSMGPFIMIQLTILVIHQNGTTVLLSNYDLLFV